MRQGIVRLIYTLASSIAKWFAYFVLGRRLEGEKIFTSGGDRCTIHMTLEVLIYGMSDGHSAPDSGGMIFHGMACIHILWLTISGKTESNT